MRASAWTFADAKARLSEVIDLAQSGARRPLHETAVGRSWLLPLIIGTENQSCRQSCGSFRRVPASNVTAACQASQRGAA
jgi:hypothetical protein